MVVEKRGFVYYLTGVQGYTEATLAKWGLDRLVEKANLKSVGTSAGPDGHIGLTLGNFWVGHKPEEQTWCDSGKGYWVGMWNAYRPTPMDLEREQRVSGHAVRLEDGNEWEIPVARYIEAGSPIPSRLVLGPGGVWKTEPLERFVMFSQVADKVAGNLYRGEAMTMGEAIEIAVMAIGMNYRIDAAGISMLGLLTRGKDTANGVETGNLQEVLGAIVDLPRAVAMAEEAFKKKTVERNGPRILMTSTVGPEDSPRGDC